MLKPFRNFTSRNNNIKGSTTTQYYRLLANFLKLVATATLVEFLASKKFSYLHIGMVQVAIKPLTRKGINASVLMCLRDARFKHFKDKIGRAHV